jgi:hypothetical protein
MSERKFVCFVLFYGAPTQFRLYDAETGNMILAYLRCYKLEAKLGAKTISPARAKRCIDSRYSSTSSYHLQ